MRKTLLIIGFIFVWLLNGCQAHKLKEIPLPQVYAGTTVPIGLKTISSENVKFLTEVARWGKGYITAMSWSPDGQQFAIASSIGIYLYDANSFEQEAFLPTEVGVSGLAFSPDGTRLIFGNKFPGEDIWLWDLTLGETHQIFHGISSASRMAFAPEGDLFVFAGGNNSVCYMKVQTDGKLKKRLSQGGFSFLADLAFSPDSTQLYVAEKEKVSILNTSPNKSIGAIITRLDHPDGADTVAASSDGQWVVANGCGSIDDHDRCLTGEIWLWSTDTWEQVNTLKGHIGRVNDLAISPDSTLIVSGADKDPEVRLWDLKSGKQVLVLTGHTSGVKRVAFSPDGRQVASESHDGTVRIWSLVDGQTQFELGGFSTEIKDLIVSPDGETIAIDNYDKTQVLDASTGGLIFTIEHPTTLIGNKVVFSSDSNLLALATKVSDEPGSDDLVQIWDIGKKQIKLSHPVSSHIDGMNFGPDQDLYITAEAYNHSFSETTIEVWNITQDQKQEILYSQTSIGHLSLYSDRDLLLLSQPPSGPFKLWDVVNNQQIIQFESSEVGSVDHLVLSPDRTLLAGASSSGEVWLWNVSNGEIFQKLVGHTWWVYDVAFSPDGKLLVSGSRDQTIRVWDVATGKLLQTLDSHSAGVTSVAFMSNGEYLVSGSHDGTIRLWGVDR